MDKKEIEAIFPAGDNPPEMVASSEETLNLPTTSVAAKGALLLGGRVAPVPDHAMWGDHFDTPVPLQASELVAVVGFVSQRDAFQPFHAGLGAFHDESEV